eukprot:comp22681_c0_seq1/m.35082 comp22681_c0_seq1/g.35082  ORF comp22681_c0_seq1/g.35082 comp22681_c0_seq1/m.35082 type:complete len:198 (-) comp22681_c0_seq1:283-876(-)
MWFLWLAGWVSTALLLVCATLCIASGLYYIAEVVEEYPQPTKRFISYSIWLAIGLNVGMGLFEGFPLYPVVLVGVVAHGIYLTLLPAFPTVEFTSLPFLGSIVVFAVHQYVVFGHFSRVWYPFGDVLTFFTLCVWLVPFAYFVSLSSSDCNLPTASEEWTQGGGPKRERAGILALFKFLSRKKDDLLPAVRSNSKAM